MVHSEEHLRRIHQPVLFLWGERDRWFPAEDARVMVDQLPSCRGFETFVGRLFVHEESHAAIGPRIVRFLAHEAANAR